MFAILKTIAEEGEIITGLGVIEIMQDGFGFFCVKLNPAFFNILYLDLLELANINFWCISVLIKIIVINTIKCNLNLRNSSFVLKMCC